MSDASATAPQASPTPPAPAQLARSPLASTVNTQSDQSIPALHGQVLLDFGRLDSTYRRHVIVVSIANQDTVAHATYSQIEQLTTMALPLTQPQFTQIWKTLILKSTRRIRAATTPKSRLQINIKLLKSSHYRYQ